MVLIFASILMSQVEAPFCELEGTRPLSLADFDNTLELREWDGVVDRCESDSPPSWCQRIRYRLTELSGPDRCQLPRRTELIAHPDGLIQTINLVNVMICDPEGCVTGSSIHLQDSRRILRFSDPTLPGPEVTTMVWRGLPIQPVIDRGRSWQQIRYSYKMTNLATLPDVDVQGSPIRVPAETLLSVHGETLVGFKLPDDFEVSPGWTLSHGAPQEFWPWGAPKTLFVAEPVQFGEWTVSGSLHFDVSGNLTSTSRLEWTEVGEIEIGFETIFTEDGLPFLTSVVGHPLNRSHRISSYGDVAIFGRLSFQEDGPVVVEAWDRDPALGSPCTHHTLLEDGTYSQEPYVWLNEHQRDEPGIFIRIDSASGPWWSSFSMTCYGYADEFF